MKSAQSAPASSFKPAADELDLTAVTWTKPTGSGGNNACFEWGSAGEYIVWRDSHNPQTVLVYTQDEVRFLLDAVRAGELDHLIG